MDIREVNNLNDESEENGDVGDEEVEPMDTMERTRREIPSPKRDGPPPLTHWHKCDGPNEWGAIWTCGMLMFLQLVQAYSAYLIWRAYSRQTMGDYRDCTARRSSLLTKR